MILVVLVVEDIIIFNIYLANMFKLLFSVNKTIHDYKSTISSIS